jgi:hypothetical protein
MRNKHLFLVILLAASFCISLGTARAALIEHNLVVEPNFVHGNERNSISSTSSRLEIALPEITLAPGDVLRVTVELADGKYLKLGPTPVDGWQQFGAGLYMAAGTLQGTTGYGDGVTHAAQIFDAASNLLFEQVVPASYFFNQNAPQIRWLPAEVGHTIDVGQPTDFTFRQWLFEIEMPTSITTSTGATFPYQTMTFTDNKLNIGYYLYSSDYVDMPEVAVYVVPEPGTISLLGVMAIAAIGLRRSFCSRADLKKLSRRVPLGWASVGCFDETAWNIEEPEAIAYGSQI